MEKLVFKKLPPKNKREEHAVRLDKMAYLEVKKISKYTHLPLTDILTLMVDFALKHTEVE